ncbi:MAG: GFA family protein [Solirubrobacteraceae bacterium]
MTIPLTGGCGCGAVRFEITEPLVAAAYCHCTRCQHRTGTAAQATARTVDGSFRLLSGEGSLGRWSPGGFDKVFCTLCGSAVFAQDPDDPDRVNVRMAAINGDPGVRPQARQFVAYAAPWEPIPDDGLPRFDERIPVA